MSLHVTNQAVDASTFASSGDASGPGCGEDESGTMFCEGGGAREPTGTGQARGCRMVLNRGKMLDLRHR